MAASLTPASPMIEAKICGGINRFRITYSQKVGSVRTSDHVRSANGEFAKHSCHLVQVARDSKLWEQTGRCEGMPTD
jgi:hypothetical protein